MSQFSLDRLFLSYKLSYKNSILLNENTIFDIIRKKE